MNCTIRPLTPEDEPFLWEMLYQAIHVPDGHAPLSRDVLHLPELARFVRGWGRERDCGFLAAVGRPVGAGLLLQGALVSIWGVRVTIMGIGIPPIDGLSPAMALGATAALLAAQIGTLYLMVRDAPLAVQ